MTARTPASADLDWVSDTIGDVMETTSKLTGCSLAIELQNETFYTLSYGTEWFAKRPKRGHFGSIGPSPIVPPYHRDAFAVANSTGQERGIWGCLYYRLSPTKDVASSHLPGHYLRWMDEPRTDTILVICFCKETMTGQLKTKAGFDDRGASTNQLLASYFWSWYKGAYHKSLGYGRYKLFFYDSRRLYVDDEEGNPHHFRLKASVTKPDAAHPHLTVKVEDNLAGDVGRAT